MSLPYGQQELPPPATVGPQPLAAHHGRGSFGPVIAVLAAIVVVGVISAMVGRLCAGGRIPGLSRYDFEGWFQSRFASCVDGRTTPPPPPAAENGAVPGHVPIVIPIEEPPATKQPRKPPRPPSEITEV